MEFDPKQYASKLTCEQTLEYMEKYEIMLDLLDDLENNIDPQRFIGPMKIVNKIINVV